MDEQHGGAPIRNACDWALLTVLCLGAKHAPVLRNFQNACSAGGVKSRLILRTAIERTIELQ